MNVKCKIDKNTKRPILEFLLYYNQNITYDIISVTHAKVVIKALKRIIVKLEKYIEVQK